jgi:predicted acyltransferase
MFLMVFVNDVDGVSNIPGWIKHSHADADALGFADTIFPAFLFIVGLSLPFALTNRIKRGDSRFQIFSYILFRTVALIVMGVFHVNHEYYAAGYLPKPVWSICTTIGFFLVWLDYPRDMRKRNRYLLQGAGVLLLTVMAVLFKGNNDGAEVWMQTYWWGILGLIGWTYGTCAAIFVLTRGKLSSQLAAFVMFVALNVAHHTGVLSLPLSPIGNGALTALTLAGVIIALMYNLMRKENKPGSLWVFYLVAVAALLFGLLVRPYTGGISKIHATPAWVFICIGLSIIFFAAVVWLVDLKRRERYFAAIRAAGTSTLTCYLIPYLLYALLQLTGFRYPDFLSEGWGGILRSFGIAFLAVWITSRLEKRRLTLKV